MTDEPARVTPLDASWPGRTLPVMPGDFATYLPQGMGLAAPAVIRPWDDPLEAVSAPSYYGFEQRDSDPIRGAPAQDPSGGVMYFDDTATTDLVRAALDLMGVRVRSCDYTVFARTAEDTVSERYLDQVRIVPKPALAHLFGAAAEAAQLPDQPITIGAYIEQFLAEQREKWNEPGYTFSSRLTGTLGGDGDWAKESLAFGFMVENSYWAVYRLWSRAWLVTK